MTNRHIKVTFRLNSAESERFKKRVQKSGLSQEAYIRSIINGLIPKEKPPPDFSGMMRELHSIGDSLDKIAREARAMDAPDAKRYDENVSKLNKAVVDIMNAVMLPFKLE